MWKWMGALAASAMLAACTTVGSWDGVEGGPPKRSGGVVGGPRYYLPKAIMRVSVNFSPDSGFSVSVAQPAMIGDVSAGLRQLYHRPSPFALDTITLNVDPSTGLLGTQTITTDDRLSEIATNLGKMLGALETDVMPTAVTDLYIEPVAERADGRMVFVVRTLDGQDASVELTQRLHSWVAFARLNPALAKTEAEIAAKARLDAWFDAAAKARFSLTYSSSDTGLVVEPSVARAVDCDVGVCARSLHPGALKVGFVLGDGTSIVLGEPPLSLPNGVRPQVVPVERQAFADLNTTVTLQNGVLTTMYVSRASPAEGVLMLVPNLVGEAIKGAGSILTERTKVEQQKLEFLNAQEALKAKRESVISANILDANLPGLSDLGSTHAGGLTGAAGGPTPDTNSTDGSTGTGPGPDHDGAGHGASAGE